MVKVNVQQEIEQQVQLRFTEGSKYVTLHIGPARLKKELSDTEYDVLANFTEECLACCAETVDSTVKRAVDLPKPKAKEEEEPTE